MLMHEDDRNLGGIHREEGDSVRGRFIFVSLKIQIGKNARFNAIRLSVLTWRSTLTILYDRLRARTLGG